MGPVRRCLRSTYFRQVKRWDDRDGAAARTTLAVEPCGRWELGARKVDIWSPSFDPMRLQAPSVTPADMVSALGMTKSSVGADDLARCAAFTERFGSRSTGVAGDRVVPPSAPASSSSGGILGFFKSVFGWGGDPEQLPIAPTSVPSSTAAIEERSHERMAVLG